jgi:hypothetical protein
MANYASTVLLAALSELSDTANKDLRKPQYGATEAFNKYKKSVIVNYDDFNLIQNKSELQTKQIDYLRRDTGTVNNSRSASLTGNLGDSTRDSLTFVTYAREFTISDSIMRNNTIAAQRFMVNQMRNARLDIGAEIESDMVTKLEAFKNTVQGDRDLGTWDSVNYVSEIANANKTEYFNYMATEMRTLDYYGMLQEIHTANANALINYQTAQGTANSANLQFQYPDFEFYTSNSITNLSDYFCTSYVVEAGSLALVDWIPGKNREGLISHAEWDFTQMPDPFGIFDRFALAVQKKVWDSTDGDKDIGGTSQDAVWVYEMSVDVAAFIPTITTQKLVNKYGLLSS